ncbi:hypothetical protein RSOL_179300 [Rhizoctonia solani AG-3 Rhs1AP]|uniref:Uncharacterized protein n=2 Tax=Rhizoctonia solani AG-3 TaxID=1086053 RepID=X8J355_9AGAM|nr:hypothetical protein RSOL_179300 [Rhizoctonia solani AG-3 Rhs1AP]
MPSSRLSRPSFSHSTYRIPRRTSPIPAHIGNTIKHPITTTNGAAIMYNGRSQVSAAVAKASAPPAIPANATASKTMMPTTSNMIRYTRHQIGSIRACKMNMIRVIS